MPPTRVLLVDDHELVRIGLRSVLELEPDLAVAGEAADGAAAIREAERLRPDIVILDVRMGELDGIAACREIRSRCPEAAVLILTSFGTEEAVLAALMAGAAGFLLKNAGRAALLAAVRARPGPLAARPGGHARRHRPARPARRRARSRRGCAPLRSRA